MMATQASDVIHARNRREAGLVIAVVLLSATVMVLLLFRRSLDSPPAVTSQQGVTSQPPAAACPGQVAVAAPPAECSCKCAAPDSAALLSACARLAPQPEKAVTPNPGNKADKVRPTRADGSRRLLGRLQVPSERSATSSAPPPAEAPVEQENPRYARKVIKDR